MSRRAIGQIAVSIIALLLPQGLGLSACAAPLEVSAQNKASVQFKKIYDSEWTWRAVSNGEDPKAKPGDVSAHLPDVSEAYQTQRLNYWKTTLEKLKAIKQSDLSQEERVNYLVYKGQIEALYDGQAFKDYQKPMNSDSNFWSDLTSVADQNLTTEAQYEAYLSMLSEIPRYFDQNIVNMKAGLARGFTPPQVTLVGREASLDPLRQAKDIEAYIYYAPFKHMPASMDKAKAEALQAQAKALLSEKVIPAHEALYTFIHDDYIPKANPHLAASDLPEGKAYYQAQIRAYTTLDKSPEEIHQLGLAEVARIHAQMLEVMKAVKFEGDLPAFLTYLRHDPQFYAKTPEALLKEAAWIAKGFDGKAKDYFGHLPRSRFAIVPVPDQIAPFYTSGRGGPGVYLVNTYDLPSRALYSLPALTLHESAPGHAFQIPLAAENKNQPEFRRRSYISAYGEGWALYSEYLGQEMGMYKTPYERFGYLSYQMWRACRLVVDTGVHAKGWTREQAVAYLKANTALSDHEIETEVDRYVSWPGQALSYYLGEMTIIAARKKAEAALGPRFNIKAFHDAILELGSVPLPVVTERIDRFISEGGKGPYPEEE